MTISATVGTVETLALVFMRIWAAHADFVLCYEWANSRTRPKIFFEHRHRHLPSQQALSKIEKAFFKSAPVIRKSVAKEMHNRKNQPHLFDVSLFLKLAFIKGKFLLAASEKRLNTPVLCIHFKNFLLGKIRLRRDEYSPCIGISKGLFRIAQQNNRFFAVAHFALMAIRIETRWPTVARLTFGSPLRMTVANAFAYCRIWLG